MHSKLIINPVLQSLIHSGTSQGAGQVQDEVLTPVYPYKSFWQHISLSLCFVVDFCHSTTSCGWNKNKNVILITIIVVSVLFMILLWIMSMVMMISWYNWWRGWNKWRGHVIIKIPTMATLFDTDHWLWNGASSLRRLFFCFRGGYYHIPFIITRCGLSGLGKVVPASISDTTDDASGGRWGPVNGDNNGE